MLIVEQNKTFVDWTIGCEVVPIDYTGELVVTFDPSKSNMAMVLGTPTGSILNVLEFSGNNRKRGPAMDTTVYCEEVRQFLRQYLTNANLYKVAVEQAITKKGMEHHHSNMVLTEIRSNLLNFFLENFGVRVMEVNNWSWKFAILPEGCRSMYEKGSKKYFRKYEPWSPFNDYFEADVTDCVCIYRYVVQNCCNDYRLYCNRAEPCLVDYSYAIYPSDSEVCKDIQSVIKNPTFTVKENLDFYVNRILKTFCMEVDIAELELEDMYGKSAMFEIGNLNDVTCRLVVARC